MRTFSFSTINVNGARDIKKRMLLYELMRLKRIDVLFAQETHSDGKNEIDWKREWDGLSVLSHKSSSSGGVAILFSKHFMPLHFEVEEIVRGQCLKVVAKFEDTTMSFLNIYAPTVGANRLLFLNTVGDSLSKLNADCLLFLAGDFNCTENDYLDRNHLEPHSASKKALKQIIEAHDLCDVWRNLHPDIKQFTWTQCRENHMSLARLDRVYVFSHQISSLKSCRIFPVSFSDHSAVICCLSLTPIKPRSAYWHFNTTLVEDKRFSGIFTLFWENFKRQKSTYSSLQLWWDCGKVLIKQLCQQYTLNVTKGVSQSIRALEREILGLQDLAASSYNEEHINALRCKKKMLDDLLNVRAQGALVRSRFQNATQMDAPSKFFFSLERKNGQSKLIHCLLSENGQELTEPAEIRKRAVGFYADLFKCELTDMEAVASTYYDDLPKVEDESATKLEEPLTLGELHSALMRMEGGRSAGIDGLPVEFYKAYWGLIGQDLLEVLINSLEKGLLPLSCRRAAIALLPKKGDLRNIGNWRPVSLLCVDFKILSKTLATRMRNVIGQVVHIDQTYCIPQRSIFDNVALIRDLLDFSRLTGIKAGLISLDQQKAFDRVEHSFLWQTLEAFGFGPGFRAMIETMYRDIESVLKINGGLSAPFKVSRGIRQGCAMSGMLYSLAIEPLLHKLRTELEGLSIPHCNSKLCLSAYADDLVVVVNGNEDIDKLECIVHDFKKFSSAAVNWAKSEALLMGNWGGQPPRLPGGLVWRRDGLKYLGVYLGNDVFLRRNWDCIVEKVLGRLEKWRWILPQLSYRGRTLIINNLVASSLWHKLACVDPPAGLLAQIQRHLVDFFWDKLHWVPQSVLFLPKDEGGQGLINLISRQATYRLQFVQKLLRGPGDLVWRPLALAMLRRVNGMMIDNALFLMDHKRLDLNELSSFYQSCFKVFGLFRQRWSAPATSLHWLLEEPVTLGARFDLCGEDTPGLTNILCACNCFQLRNVVEKAGNDLKNARALASALGVRSLRYASRVLAKLLGFLNVGEGALLEGYCSGNMLPNDNDPFPDFVLITDWLEPGFTSPLLNLGIDENLNLATADGKAVYKVMVKTLNKNHLKGRTDTVWREKLGIDGKTRPVWRVFYKPPLTKRTGDLQWRILHGAIAVNAVTAVMNPDVNDKCPYCNERETIFHCFMECTRLMPMFVFLNCLLNPLGVVCSKQSFVLGFPYSQKRRAKCQLINFIVGQAKLAIYLSRKNKMHQMSDCHVVPVLRNLMMSRVSLDFCFYKAMDDLNTFVAQWCCEKAVCSVEDDDDLVFSF